MADDDALVETVAEAAWRGSHLSSKPPAWAGFNTLDPVAQDVFRVMARSVVAALREVGLLREGGGDPAPTCGCVHCQAEQARLRPWPNSLVRTMSLCPECGNKRCPKATHHSNACTGSNEPGQPGSAY